MSGQRSRSNIAVYTCLTEIEGQYEIRKAITIIILTLEANGTSFVGIKGTKFHSCRIDLKGIKFRITHYSDFEILIFLKVNFIYIRLLAWFDVDGNILNSYRSL